MTAKTRYLLAAAFWASALAWLAVAPPEIRGVYGMLLSLAITSTICAAIVERDERVQQVVRLAWWARGGVQAAEMPPVVPAQRAEPAHDVLA